MLQVTFREIAAVLETAGSQVVAAEGHGCLCGALCTSADYSFDRWVEEIVALDADPAAERPAEEPLKLLFADTVHALRGDEMQFEPLLPDDDEPLERRASALAQWCQGFLYGFGTGRRVDAKHLNAQVDEILKDFMHIARAEVDVGAASEAEEESYSEVVEYLRVGVQLIHDELMPLREGEISDDDPDAPPDHDADADDYIH
jgi:uncharacterized protein